MLVRLLPMTVALLVALAGAARAQQGPHTGLRADVELGFGDGRHRPDDGQGAIALPAYLQLDASLHYVIRSGAKPLLGIGTHLGFLNLGNLTPYAPGSVDSRQQVRVFDLGASPLLVFPADRWEFTFRTPAGLTVTQIDFHENTFIPAENDSNFLLSHAETNRPCWGYHVAGLLGAKLWLGQAIAITVEAGVLWHAYRQRIDGQINFTAGTTQAVHVERNWRLLTGTALVGMAWGQSTRP